MKRPYRHFVKQHLSKAVYYLYIRKEKNMLEKVIEILQGIREDVDYEAETALIDDGILDSFDIVGLVSELNDEFEVEINVDDLTPANFNSAENIVELIRKLQDEE